MVLDRCSPRIFTSSLCQLSALSFYGSSFTYFPLRRDIHRSQYKNPFITANYTSYREDGSDLWHGNKGASPGRPLACVPHWTPACRPQSVHCTLCSRLLPKPRRTKIRVSHVEDAFWATISVLCEERLSEALVRLGG